MRQDIQEIATAEDIKREMDVMLSVMHWQTNARERNAKRAKKAAKRGKPFRPITPADMPDFYAKKRPCP